MLAPAVVVRLIRVKGDKNKILFSIFGLISADYGG
jgi:hypothetical protein